MDFYAGNMSLLNDIAQIENDAGPSGSAAAPALPRPEGYAPLDADADGAVWSDHRLERGVQSGHHPGQSEHVYQQAFSEYLRRSQIRSASRRGVQSGSRRSSPNTRSRA